MTNEWSPLFHEAVQSHRVGDLTRAEQLYRRVIAEEDNHAAANSNLGVILAERGNLVQAEKHYRTALEVDPQLGDAYVNLGNLLAKLQRVDEAAAAYKSALAASKPSERARGLLIRLLFESGRDTEVIELLRRYTDEHPGESEGWHLLGMAHLRQGEAQAALPFLRRAVELEPQRALPHNSLGLALDAAGEPDASAREFEIAASLNPPSAEAFNNLAMIRVGEGRAPDAIPLFQRSLSISPQQPLVHSNLLLTMNYIADWPPGVMLAEHRRWAAQFADSLPPVGQQHRPRPDGVLHVGYVSSDFRGHPVAAYLGGVLAAHDRKAVRTTCYATLFAADAVTERLKAASDNWRDITRLSDQAAAEMIRDDRVDVLVDLGGHTSRNRLRIFARRAAPVQVAHFAYPNTTGLKAMDYRLTDGVSDPPGSEVHYVERLVGLPDIAWCWQPPDEAPDVSPLPAGNAGPITFGCLNNAAKLTEPTIQLFARVLQAVPDSRLIVLGSKSRTATDRVGELLARAGVPDRVDVWPRSSPAEYYAAHHRIDLALDTFPYNGGVTTCDALWMGVPVVSRVGNTYAARQGASILRCVGLAELAANSADEFAAICADWAGHRDRLQATRAGLRDRLRASPLLDAERFTRHLEAAYRRMVESL